VRHPSDTTTVKPGRLRDIAAVLHKRLDGEEGFTLIELTIVLIILGILLTIAVPSYLSFKDRAAKTAVRADVAQTMRSVNAYAADNFPNAANDPDASAIDNGYTGITLAALATKYDASISTVPGSPFVVNPAGFTGSPTDFCLTAAIGRWVAAQHGPGGTIQVGTLFTPGTCTVT
jgi:prepilin-type N-terminal cleavage/methylation domain-containing protein